MRLVKLLVGHPPRTVGELIDESGVTRTAITGPLNELESAGFVERTIELPSGRGRPCHRYSATQAALVLLLVNNQQLVVPAIWKAINECGGKKLTKRILHLVSRTLAAYYQAKITAPNPKKHLEQFVTILEQEGGLIALVADKGQVTIMKRTCPYIGMLDEQQDLCEIDVELMSAIAGLPVRRVSCLHDGDPCCQLEIDTRSSSPRPAPPP